METFSATDAYVALLIGYFEAPDLIDWAQRYAKEHPELSSDSTLFEIAWLNRKRKDELSQAVNLMERFVTESEPGFNVVAEETQTVARALFESRLQNYLSSECTPWEVCRMVQPIEELYDYPDWLGDMFNACDWIEPDAKPVDCRHLEHAIREHLEGLSGGNL